MSYAELHVTSNFTFLTGASHPQEFVHEAAALGYHAIAITDVNTVAGIVRAHSPAQEIGMRFVVGSRLVLAARHGASSTCGLAILIYPTNRKAYGRLCRLLTLGKRRATKGECHLTLPDLIEHQEGLLAAIIPPPDIDDVFVDTLHHLRDIFNDDRLSIASSCLYGPDDRGRLQQLITLSRHTNVPLLATNDAHYHTPDRRMLQDVVTCIRHGCTLDEAGLKLFPHGERCLKPPQEMARLFAECPEAIARSVEIADRAAFSLSELRYEYPHETVPPGKSPMQHLTDLTWRCAVHRYPQGVPAPVKARIEHELQLIEELNYPHYFLTVHDLVEYACSQGILCQGRGAAANSAVCYCLGITAVDPARIDLLFERFISRERNEPPDIDIDFEHERREEVIQYLYNKYGRDRAALTAEVITYRGRSAVREVGKALGLSLDCVDRLAKNMDWWDRGEVRADRLRELGLSAEDKTICDLTSLVNNILGFPRHLSQHVGGFVLTEGPLCESVPIKNAAMPDRTVIEWDKDDIDALDMLKVDCLGLGMLTCIQKCFELVKQTIPAACGLALHTVPPEDPHVYDMICDADTVGVFQIESRAQMSMLPRLRPRCYYDLVIEVAIVRPGPIQGNMVHPYLRRRNGEEPVTYPNDEVKRVLGKTLGVPLFQEQAMSLAMVAGGFTADEADQLRRAMAAWKRKGDKIFRFGEKLIAGMLRNGYERAFADRCFEQIKGFSEYGFPESHAASFALIVYVSAWLKHHYPAAFAAALINSQPMGFYAPAQIVRDAREHGVAVRPVDVNFSGWDCRLEERDEETQRRRDGVMAMRLGMRLVKGLREEDAQKVATHAPYGSIDDVWRRGNVSVSALRTLAQADAFQSLGLDRQHALWQVRQLRDEKLPLFDAPPTSSLRLCVSSSLPSIPPPRKVIHDYQHTGLSLKSHPIHFIRDQLDAMRVTPAHELAHEDHWANGDPIAVAGLVLVRQRPSTASGIVFMTLEDETGVSNLIVRPAVFERYRKAARHGVFILARGRVERQGQVVHIMAMQIEDLGDCLGDITSRSRDFH